MQIPKQKIVLAFAVSVLLFIVVIINHNAKDYDHELLMMTSSLTSSNSQNKQQQQMNIKSTTIALKKPASAASGDDDDFLNYKQLPSDFYNDCIGLPLHEKKRREELNRREQQEQLQYHGNAGEENAEAHQALLNAAKQHRRLNEDDVKIIQKQEGKNKIVENEVTTIIERSRVKIRSGKRDFFDQQQDDNNKPQGAATNIVDQEDAANFIFYPQYVIRPEPGERKQNRWKKGGGSSSVQQPPPLYIDAPVLDQLKKDLYTWFYLYSTQIAAPRSITYLVTSCGNSGDLLREEDNTPKFPHHEDCAHVVTQLRSFKAALGHVVVFVSGESKGDLQWLDIFGELEMQFASRFTVLHRPSPTKKKHIDCAKNWNFIANLVFEKVKPKADRILFTSANFHSNGDWLPKFANFNYNYNPRQELLLARFMDPVNQWNMNGIGTPKTYTCSCYAFIVTKSGYFQSESGFQQHQQNSNSVERSNNDQPQQPFNDGPRSACEATATEFYKRLRDKLVTPSDVQGADTFIHPKTKEQREMQRVEKMQVRGGARRLLLEVPENFEEFCQC